MMTNVDDIDDLHPGEPGYLKHSGDAGDFGRPSSMWIMIRVTRPSHDQLFADVHRSLFLSGNMGLVLW